MEREPGSTLFIRVENPVEMKRLKANIKMSITCINCCAADLETGAVSLSGTVREEDYSVQMPGLVCPQCGFQTIEGSAMPEFGRLLADEYRNAHGLLNSGELRSRRETLGMSQTKFAEYLGVGVASVKRWEMGRIQESAMDELIRLKTEPEAARRNLEAIVSQVAEHLVISAVGNEIELEMLLAASYVEQKPQWTKASSVKDFSGLVSINEGEPLAA